MRRILALSPLVLCFNLSADQPSDWPRRPLGEESRSARVAEAGRRSNAVGAVSHLLLPTSVNANGQFGSVYKTKVSIFNAMIATYNIRVGLSVGGGELTHTFITIGPGQTLTFNNILSDLFGYVGGGAIDLDSGNTIYQFIVNAQVYVDTISGRHTTAVQFADDLGDIIPSRPGFVVGVSINSARRLNIGCASNAQSNQTVTFKGFDANYNGVGTTFSFNLAGFGWVQYSLNLPLANGGVYITASDNAVCYAVEVDNTSNDGTFQLATPF